MRIFNCTPIKSTIFGINQIPPATLYLGSWGVQKLKPSTAYTNVNAQFFFEHIDSPNCPDTVYVSDTATTIQGLINDFDTNGSYQATVVTVNGNVPVNTTKYLEISNIIWFYVNPTNSGQTLMLYWDSINNLVETYILTGTPSSIQTAINAIAGGDVIGYPQKYTSASGIVAHAGGGQQTTGASLLLNEINIVGTVATTSDSVTIGAASAVGQRMMVINLGANTATVYPFTSGTINGGSANAGVSLLIGQVLEFVATSTTNWETQDYVEGVFSNLFVLGRATFALPNNYSSQTGITAQAGGGQQTTGASTLTKEYSNVTVCVTANDSVTFAAAAVVGTVRIIKNNGATNLSVYPFTGGTIDGGGANASVTIVPGQEVLFWAISTTDWESNIGSLVSLAKANTWAATQTFGVPNIYTPSQQTANPGGGQGSANAIVYEYTQYNVVASDYDSALLPSATPGMHYEVQNTAAHILAVFPSTGQDINGQGANLPVFLLPGEKKVFWCAVSTHWYSNNSSTMVTTPVSTVQVMEYQNGQDVYTMLILTDFIVGALAGAAAALGVGNIVAAYPTGDQHLELVYGLSGLKLKAAGTGVTGVIGLGSVIATGAVSVLSGTSTFQDRMAGQAITVGSGVYGTAINGMTCVTAGIGTGIGLNGTGAVKNVFLNCAATWGANETGNLTATGRIIFKWTKMI